MANIFFFQFPNTFSSRFILLLFSIYIGTIVYVLLYGWRLAWLMVHGCIVRLVVTQLVYLESLVVFGWFGGLIWFGHLLNQFDGLL